SIVYSMRIFSRFFKKGSCLELGPGEGISTQFLVQFFDDLTCVDGSQIFCTELQQKFPKVKVICSLFETFFSKRRFDNVVLGRVLEHVISPLDLLLHIKENLLAAEGVVFASVPNAKSIHRQLAVIMGILENEHSLNETDIKCGHRRVYDPQSFCKDFLDAGYTIIHFGGYWLKPVSNAQIRESWTPQMLNAAMVLGERYPDIAAEIYVVATAK
ncbi:MAG: class I SAM-dependent methyltransferase, partial [Deltaproteobacteria bacterium]|nr:class I SAM-dependent methyltransferase [Deltaproteobacteria bacterium]